MGWSIGYDSNWKRDVGYGVPAFCDHPRCPAVIDRGLSYVCGGEPYGGDKGCGLYFCWKHGGGSLCWKCLRKAEPFKPKPEHPDWIRHKLTHESWAIWRSENPADVAALRCRRGGLADGERRRVELEQQIKGMSPLAIYRYGYTAGYRASRRVGKVESGQTEEER